MNPGHEGDRRLPSLAAEVDRHDRLLLWTRGRASCRVHGRKIMDEPLEVGIGPGGVDPFQTLVQLVRSEPAVARRVAQTLGNLVSVGVGGAHLTRAVPYLRLNGSRRVGPLGRLGHGDSLERQAAPDPMAAGRAPRSRRPPPVLAAWWEGQSWSAPVLNLARGPDWV
jgi:hypothetical protein